MDPDVVVESKAGEARALEVRELPPGIPLEPWAVALAAIEEAQSLRLLRALAEGEEERVARPTFAYRSVQSLRLSKLLARARAARPWLARLLDPERPPPLSRTGFTALCRARLFADLPEARIARAHGAHLELQLGESCVRAPVAPSFDLYLEDLDEDAATGRVLAAARALSGQDIPPVALWDRERALAGLLPTLLAGEPGTRATLIAAPGLPGALLCDDGERISPVLASDLAALGLTPAEAFERALFNADALTEKAPEAVRWFDLDHGRVVTCEFKDPGGAGRLLSPAARELLLQVLGVDRAFAIAPTRDALLACAVDDDEGARLLAREARQRFADGPFPLTPLTWLLTADSVEPVAAPPDEPSGELDDVEGEPE